MPNNLISKLSNSFSTGGGGISFEHQVQAMFLLSLLVDGFCPAMNEPTKRVCFQTKYLHFDTDDLMVITKRGELDGKMLCSIKHKIVPTEKNQIFKEVIASAWKDFNKDGFDKKRDRIALIVSVISPKKLSSLRFLHDLANTTIDEDDFYTKVSLEHFSNEENTEMLNILENLITSFDDKNENLKREVWNFCKVFIILLFDLNYTNSINKTLSESLIKCKSHEEPCLVWSKLVEYASYCDKNSASISIENFNVQILELFSIKKNLEFEIKPVEEVDHFIADIALIGSWRVENKNDQLVIEKLSGMPYSSFENKAKGMLLQYPSYFTFDGSVWRIKHKEELFNQCKDTLVEGWHKNLIDVANNILLQKSNKILNPNGLNIEIKNDFKISYELENSLIQSVCLINKISSKLCHCNTKTITNDIVCMVRKVLENAKWNTWSNLNDYLRNLAELAPSIFLNEVEKTISNSSQESDDELFENSNHATGLLLALETIAWLPDYCARSICTIGLLEKIGYEINNPSITPVKAICSILFPWRPQTFAPIETRKNALKSLKNENEEVCWKVLRGLFPNHTELIQPMLRPKYIQLENFEEKEISRSEAVLYFDFILELAVDIACDDNEKKIDLIDQMGYMKEQLLLKFLSCLENDVDFYEEEVAYRMWKQFRKCLLSAKLTKDMVIYPYVIRIKELVNRLEPKDIRVKYKELFTNKYWWLNAKDNGVEIWEQEGIIKQNAIKSIFKKYGIEETEKFGISVDKVEEVAWLLGRVITDDELHSIIISCHSNTVSIEFLASCIEAYISNNDIEELLNDPVLNTDKKFALELLTKVKLSTKIYIVVEKLNLNNSKYWKKASIPIVYLDSKQNEMKMIANNLITYKRYVTAVNLIGRTNIFTDFTDEELGEFLELAGTKESYGKEKLDEYAVHNIMTHIQNSNDISLNKMSDIEFIYLPLLIEAHGMKPCALYKRIALDPEYFCSLIEMFYKKKTEKDCVLKLDEAIGSRLFKILFMFKVVPGADSEGEIDEEIFKTWMDFVKTWSEESDRYEVTMNTVGQGLSYAKLDNDGHPCQIIMKELNGVENEELRRGYNIGIINQRWCYTVDPEGKPEMELAKNYSNMARKAEEKGYPRYADTLRNISNQYKLEAQDNIAEAKNAFEEYN